MPASVCQNGVMDDALHPIEPFASRLTVAATFCASPSGNGGAYRRANQPGGQPRGENNFGNDNSGPVLNPVLEHDPKRSCSIKKL
jgi:hypothetical protein